MTIWSIKEEDRGTFLLGHGAYVCGPYPDVWAAIIHIPFLAATMTKIPLIPANN